MERAILDRRRMEADLRDARRDGAFALHYRPIVLASGGEVAGSEALLRWNHPERGPISPAAFVPGAEETGLIGPIGEWVMRRACSEAAGWPGEARGAVNLSPAQFGHGTEPVGLVAATLRETELPARRLCLEITESVLLRDDDATLGTLRGLRALGVGISLDDFGTGYSSLSYLRRFPFDRIKIDQSFVREMLERPDRAAIVRSAVGLARDLGMTIVAEGVETSDQYDRIVAEGCHEIQGYLISRPLPAEAARALVASSAKAA